jgi:hypothetical protein
LHNNGYLDWPTLSMIISNEQADKTNDQRGAKSRPASSLKHISSAARIPICGVQPRRVSYDTQKRKRGNEMNLDLGQLTPLLNQVSYPIGTTQLIQFAEQHGANEQILELLSQLPGKTFNSSQDVINTLNSLGNLGNLGNLGGLKL